MDGKGHAKRDIVEWMLPPLWPWKVTMLPARGPRPQLKGETVLSLRLMDDIQIPQLAQTFGPNWHFFGRLRNESFRDAQAKSLARVDLPAAILPHKKINFAEVFMPSNSHHTKLGPRKLPAPLD
jgi:hypothetical protein